MTARVRVHPEAEREFLDAVRYYETAQSGLGDDFDVEVARAVHDIERDPDAWPKFPGWSRLPIVRSRRVNVYPFRVVYFVREREVMIVAFAHQSRRPGYWRQRVAG